MLSPAEIRLIEKYLSFKYGETGSEELSFEEKELLIKKLEDPTFTICLAFSETINIALSEEETIDLRMKLIKARQNLVNEKT